MFQKHNYDLLKCTIKLYEKKVWAKIETKSKSTILLVRERKFLNEC